MVLQHLPLNINHCQSLVNFSQELSLMFNISLGRVVSSSACNTPAGRPLLAFAYRKVVKRHNKSGQLPHQQQLTFRNLAGIGIFWD